MEPVPTDDSASQQRLFALLYEELHRLAQRELRYISPKMGISERTLKRDWRKARLFLHEYLAGHDLDEPA